MKKVFIKLTSNHYPNNRTYVRIDLISSIEVYPSSISGDFGSALIVDGKDVCVEESVEDIVKFIKGDVTIRDMED